MPLYKFGSNDIFRNRVKTHPRTSFVINNGEIIYNGEIIKSGSPKEITSDKFVKKIYLGDNYQ